MRDGTISTDGLDTFKLGYEFVRDEIGMRRDYLKRHASEVEKPARDAAPSQSDDSNVVVVKTAQSA